MLRRTSPTKIIKFYFKPLVNVRVNFVIFITQGLTRDSFLKSLGLCSRAVFISTTYVQIVETTDFAKSTFSCNKLIRLNENYLAKTSALRTAPMIFPKCGTLLTYGRAEVIK